MNAMLNSPAVQAFCEGAFVVILDSAAKGLVLLLLAWAVAASMRRSSAATRHMVWALALGGLLMLPILSLALPKWQLPILPQSAAPPAPFVVPASAGINAESSSHAPSSNSSIIPPEGGTPEPIYSKSEPIATPKPAFPPTPPRGFWIVAIWLVFSLICLIPLGAGILLVRNIMRDSIRLDRAPWPALIEALSSQMLLRRRVQVMKSSGPTMPMAVGVMRPAVILPAETESWPDEKRRAVLLHELAHIRRWDCLTHILTRLACVMHWFNPLAWMALHKLQNERERACDDLAIEAGARPVNYAHQLFEIARTMQTSAATATAAIPMARKTQLEGRLLAILDATRNRRGLTRLATVASLVIMAAIVLPLSCTQLTKYDKSSKYKPQIEILAHRYYQVGWPISIEYKIGEWAYKSVDRSPVFFRVDGKDVKTGISTSLSSGGTMYLENRKSDEYPDGMPYMTPGRHKLALGFRNVKVGEDRDGKTQVLTVFNEIITNEVEYEIVDRVPDGYMDTVRGKDLADTIRQKFTDIRYHSSQFPNFSIRWQANVPVNLAYDIAIQAEGEATSSSLTSMTLASGGIQHGFTFGFDEGADLAKRLANKRVRLIMTPSAKAASKNPAIREFCGETVITDWMRLKPHLESSVNDLENEGLAGRTSTDMRRDSSGSPEPNMGIIMRPGNIGGGIEVMQGSRTRLLQLNGVTQPKEAIEAALMNFEKLAASNAKRVEARPDDFIWTAIQSESGQRYLMVIDASPNLDQQFYWWNMNQKIEKLVVISGKGDDKQRYEFGLGNGSSTYFYLKAKKRNGQLEYKYLGSGPEGRKYHIAYGEQFDARLKEIMAKDIVYDSGNMTVFENDDTWIGIEVRQTNAASASDKISTLPSQDSARLDGGIVVSLEGVSGWPLKKDGWWKPDGSLLAHAPIDVLRAEDNFWQYAPKTQRVFAVRLEGRGRVEDVDAKVVVMPSSFSKGYPPVVPKTTSPDTWEMVLPYLASIPDAPADHSVWVDVASGPWRTWDRSPRGGTSFSTLEGSGQFLEAVAVTMGTQITMTDTLTDMQSRVTATDMNRREHVGNVKEQSNLNGTRTVTYFFPGLDLKEIRNFAFQTRQYTQVRFKNVSINSGAKTEPKVEIVKPAKLQAVEDTAKREYIFLPSMKTDEAAALDLQSGNLIRLADETGKKADPATLWKHGLGDLVYDGKLIVLRGGTLMRPAAPGIMEPAKPLSETNDTKTYELKTLIDITNVVTGAGEIWSIGFMQPTAAGVSLVFEKISTTTKAQSVANSVDNPSTKPTISPVRYLAERSKTKMQDMEKEYHWLIDTTKPIRVGRGWLSLGQDDAVQGDVGGCEDILDGGPVELILKTTRDTNYMYISIESKRDTRTTQGGSKVQSKTEIPEGTIFEESWLISPSFVNRDQLTSLWEGRFIRSGNVVKTVIFAANATDSSTNSLEFRPAAKNPDGFKGSQILRLRNEMAAANQADGELSSVEQFEVRSADDARKKAHQKIAQITKAYQAVAERMRLIRSKKLKFEYTRTVNDENTPARVEKCTLLAYTGRYREEVLQPDGKTVFHYFTGVPRDSSEPNRIEGFRATIDGSSGQTRIHQYSSHHWIDATLARQWSFPTRSYGTGLLRQGNIERIDQDGQSCVKLVLGQNQDLYAPDLGWALLDDSLTRFSDFAEIDGIHLPRQAVRDRPDRETLAIQKIDANADFDSGLLNLPKPRQGTEIGILCPLWEAEPDLITIAKIPNKSGSFHITWGGKLSEQDLRYVTVAMAWCRGANFGKALDTGYPMPYFDRERNCIIWVNYDNKSDLYTKVFEGDRLPESYGPLPWQDLIDMVKGWAK